MYRCYAGRICGVSWVVNIYAWKNSCVCRYGVCRLFDSFLLSNTSWILSSVINRVSKGPNGEPGVVIVHVEACTHLHRALGRIRAAGGSPSVALNPHTPAEMIENVLDLVDHVLVMTVNPGFGGQAYIPTMTEKIKKIRKWIVDRDLDVDIEVDGGIKATQETIGECAAAGANCFIAGSGLFAYDDLSEGVKELTDMALEAQGVAVGAK